MAARALASVLLENADALDLDDLRAADALTEVRRASRRLAESVYGRGWGDLFLGVLLSDMDTVEMVQPAGGAPVRGEDFQDDSDGEDEFEDSYLTDDDEGLPLPDGARITYQARFDFVVTDPQRAIDYVQRRISADSRNVSLEPRLGIESSSGAAPPRDLTEALGLLAYLDGLGSQDYTEYGLEFAGGQEIVRPIDEAFWEMSQDRQSDHYPFE